MGAPPTTAAFDPATLIAGLPHLPGVYRMLSASGDVLYVGKARDLKKRVASYFQKSDHGPRIQLMLAQVTGVEVTVTGSEGEALLLENNLIKSLAPRYNILFRDDKSYPYLMIGGGCFPRLGFHRGALDRHNTYFGPFPGASAVRESIQLLQKVFRLRTCEDSVFQNRSRPCLLYQIHRCSAPCVGLVSEADYAADARNAALFMEGREDDVLTALAARMQAASDRLDFESAAVHRDQIKALSALQQRQYVDTAKSLDADAVACVEQGGAACVNLVMIRNGRYLGDRSFFPEHAESHAPADIVAAFLAQHYLQAPPPAVIVVEEKVEEAIEAAELSAALSQRAARQVQIVSRPHAERRAWLEMAARNAELALAQRTRERGTQEVRLAAMREALGLPPTVQRVECFDVSHTMGEATVAACVVYDQLRMRNSEYRRYNITGVAPGDDYGALRSALQRRYERITRGEGVVPDLILIDGGKGQVNTARAVLAELGLSDVYLVGVAKGPERRPGLEELVVGDGERPLNLDKGHPGLHLIQQIRDEAHRFAIAGHRARRGKARVTSTLEGIAGIGATRRRQLLERFGGLKGVAAASVEDLAQVEGISRTLAERIYRELH
ncbi:MAG: excinuclease ABC subunit UvrC [Burkholderiales bacterium]|nr:excinuclease ABC subunit UvrC [Burkholderiales bacterium]